MWLLVETLVLVGILYGVYVASFTDRGMVRIPRLVGLSILIVGFLVMPVPIKAMVIVVGGVYFLLHRSKVAFFSDY